MVLKFEVDDVKEFSNIINVTEEYVPELRINADETGLNFTALNQGHVVFINCDMNKEYFNLYECSEPTSFMVDTQELKKALGRIKGGGVLTCNLLDDVFELEPKSDGSSKTFKLNLISELYDSPTPPLIEYPLSVVADFSRFKEYVLDAMSYKDAILFEFTDKGLEVNCASDYAEYHGVLSLSDIVVEYCRVAVSGEYLSPFLKLALSDRLCIDTGTDMPFNASIQSVDECLNYKVLVAPRLDNTE